MQHKDIIDHFRHHIHDPELREKSDESFQELFDYTNSVFQKRMDIYRNNVFTSLSNVILSRHKILKALIGEEFLDMVARRYIREKLPSKACLDEYALDFDSFLRQQPEVKDLPYLADITRLETNMHVSKHVEDEPELDLQKIQTLSPESLERVRFLPKKSLGTLKSEWPIFSIYHFCLKELGLDQETEDVFEDNDLGANAAIDPNAEKDVTKIEKGANTQTEQLDISTGGKNVFYLRQGFKVELYQCDKTEYLFLSAILNGKNLQISAETALKQDEGFDLGLALQKHFNLGSFTSYYLEE